MQSVKWLVLASLLVSSEYLHADGDFGLMAAIDKKCGLVSYHAKEALRLARRGMAPEDVLAKLTEDEHSQLRRDEFAAMVQRAFAVIATDGKVVTDQQTETFMASETARCHSGAEKVLDEISDVLTQNFEKYGVVIQPAPTPSTPVMIVPPYEPLTRSEIPGFSPSTQSNHPKAPQ